MTHCCEYNSQCFLTYGRKSLRESQANAIRVVELLVTNSVTDNLVVGEANKPVNVLFHSYQALKDQVEESRCVTYMYLIVEDGLGSLRVVEIEKTFVECMVGKLRGFVCHGGEAVFGGDKQSNTIFKGTPSVRCAAHDLQSWNV